MNGRVILVGAGPGDPGLMTVRATEAIAEGDVILHDHLIPPNALTYARANAEVIDVGKIGRGEQVPQTETERLMLMYASEGKTVVRLKGGDPFVFGRGGEEALACHRAGIPFEVVPGVTAGIAAAAFAGIPVTYRGIASAVAFVTARTGGEDHDWDALARFPGTLVFYMGVKALPAIAENLIAAGRSGDEPVAVVQSGTLPAQRVVRTTLQTLGEDAEAGGIRAPAVTVIGPVAALAGQLDWLAGGPLTGVSVVVTRTPRQSSGLAKDLQRLGARVIDAPAIAIEPLHPKIPDLGDHDLLVLTSPNGARLFFEGLRDSGRDARALASMRVAVVGPGTAAAVRGYGIEPDVVPSRAIGEGLVESLAAVPVKRALVARAAQARDLVIDALRDSGADVDVLALYETKPVELKSRILEAVLAADWALFASASAARHFVAACGGPDVLSASALRYATIGPQTSAGLRDAGLRPDVEAEQHTPEGLISALLHHTTSDAG